MTWADGKVYIGEFMNDKKEGSGTFSYPDGRQYIGQFKKGLQHGHGKLINSEGLEQWGYWEKGKRCEFKNRHSSVKPKRSKTTTNRGYSPESSFMTSIRGDQSSLNMSFRGGSACTNL